MAENDSWLIGVVDYCAVQDKGLTRRAADTRAHRNRNVGQRANHHAAHTSTKHETCREGDKGIDEIFVLSALLGSGVAGKTCQRR